MEIKKKKYLFKKKPEKHIIDDEQILNKKK